MTHPLETDPRRRAQQLRKAGEYQSAAELFQQLWQESGGDPWDGWGLAFCLRKQGQPREAARVCKQVESHDPTFKPAYDLHGWCLYDTYLRDTDQYEPRTIVEVVGGIAKCARLSGDPYGQYSPLVRSVFKGIDTVRDPYRPEQSLDLLEHLEPSKLDPSPEMVRDRQQQIRIPGQMERYYLHQTKALERLERWEECQAACAEALESIPTHVAEGGFWIRRRLAIALAHTGNADLARTMMEGFVADRTDWYLFDDLAVIETQAGDLESAAEHLKTALRSRGPMRMKVKTLARLSDLLAKLGEVGHARTHAELALAIRTEQGWGSNQQLDELLNDLGADPAPDRQEAEAALKEYWNESKPTVDRTPGTVTAVIADGHAGFIRLADGSADVYFRMVDAQDPSLVAGDAVTCVVKPNYDRKKERMSQIAVDISRV